MKTASAKRIGLSYDSSSILDRRLLHVVHHDHFQHHLFLLQLKPQFLLYRGCDDGVGIGWRSTVRCRGFLTLLAIVGFDVEEVVISSRQPRLIDHRIMQRVRYEIDHLAHRGAPAGEAQLMALKARRTLGVHRLEFMPALRHSENERGHFLGIPVYDGL